jgi:hypothetical protein
LYVYCERPFVVLSHTVANRLVPARAPRPVPGVATASPAIEGRP